MNRIWIAALFLSVPLASVGQAQELKTLSGKNVAGALEKITESDIVMGGTATPLAQALDLTLRPARPQPSAEKYLEVQLADDSVVRCTKITYGPKEVQLDLTSGASLKVPLSGILTVLRDAQDEKLRAQFAKLSKTKRRADRIFILSGGDLNPIDGVFGAIDEGKQRIKFKPEATPELEPEIAKLQAIQFARVDSPAENGMAKVIDIDGNLVLASKLSYDAGTLTATTPFGQKFALDSKLLARIDFNLGRLTFLSDLPETVQASPFLGGFNPVRKNVSLDGTPIMVNDKQYAKGLSSYAGAKIEYNLGKKYKKLTGILSVDLRIAEEGQGKVTVTIYTDREKKFSQEVSTKAPTPINVDVRDVELLRIEIEGPNETPFHGHAVLANAQVSQ